MHLLLIQAHGIVDGLPRDLPKNCVLAVKVITAVHCDEELAVVRVGCVLVGASHQAPARTHTRSDTPISIYTSGLSLIRPQCAHTQVLRRLRV